jgi:hypothetical protein
MTHKQTFKGTDFASHHTRDELLTSRVQKHEHVPQTHSDGGRHPNFYVKDPSDPSRLISHDNSVPNVARGMEHQTRTGPTLGKPPKPKRVAYEAIPIAAGALSVNRSTGEFHFGGQEASRRFDADPASPLDGPPRGKRLSPPAINPGCRDRSGDALSSEAPGIAHARTKRLPDTLADLGRAILDEALHYSAADDRAALANNFGTLRAAVKEST